MDTTDNFDGSIESAAELLLQPEEQEEIDDNAEEESAEIDNDDVEEEQEESDADDDDETDAEADDESEEDADDDEDSEQDEEEPKEQLITVNVDGTEKAVTLDELKRGYSGQQYIQKGMEEAAAQRKEAGEVYDALMNERRELAQLKQQVLSGGAMTQPQPPSRELFDSDPIAYMEAKLNYDEGMQQYQQQLAQLGEVENRQTQAEADASKEALMREAERLKAVMPELADPKQASSFRENLMKVGQEAYGYSAEEISQVTDHRAFLLIRDAMKYREIVNGKEKAEKKAKTVKRKVVRSGSKKTDSNTSQARKQKARLKSSGSIDDAVSLIMGS